MTELAPGAGSLAVVATPLGNRDDITVRALRVLAECDAVVAEDSRHTRALLTAHGIAREVVSLPAFDEARRVPALVQRMQRGATLALCTDAGTPGVSDPGAALVRSARGAGVPVTAVPGASAVTAALSVSGFPASSFVFLGFLPRTPGKLVRRVEAALALDVTLAFLESPMRLATTLLRLTDTLGAREVMVGRELTKLHEECVFGTADALAARYTERAPRGECTVLVAP